MVRHLAWACFAAALSLAPGFSSAQEPRRVAVLPLEIYGDAEFSSLGAGLADLLASRIAGDPRVALVGAAAVEAALPKKNSARLDEAAAAGLAKELGADAVVWGSLTRLGKSTAGTLKLTRPSAPAVTRYFPFAADSPDEVLPRLSTLAGEIRQAVLASGTSAERVPETRSVPPPAAPPAPAPAASPPRSPTDASYPFGGARLWTSDDLPFAARGMAIADVDGDGKKEITLIDETRVHVYRFADDALTLLAEYHGQAYEDFLSVSVLEGRPARIFVTSMRDGPRSFALEYGAGALRRLEGDLRFFLRRVDGVGGDGLLGQEESSGPWPFREDIRRLVAEANAYALGPTADLPKGFALYHFAAGDLNGDGKNEYLALDGEGRLLAYAPDKKFLGETGGSYGRSCVTWARARPGGDEAGPDQTVEIPVEIVLRDIDGDGRAEALIARNISEGLLSLVASPAAIQRSEVVALKWDGGRFRKAGTLEGIDGCTTGLSWADVDGNGTDELIVLTTKLGGAFRGGARSNLQIHFR